MSIDRVPHVPFAQIANSALRDTRLSYTARGILAMVLSHPGEWRADRAFLQSKTQREGQKAIQNALNELTDLGYRQVIKSQDERGRWQSYVQWFHQSKDDRTGCDYADPSVYRPSVPVTANKNTIKNINKCSYCGQKLSDKKHFCSTMNVWL